jgi:hypothetical protein
VHDGIRRSDLDPPEDGSKLKFSSPCTREERALKRKMGSIAEEFVEANEQS